VPDLGVKPDHLLMLQCRDEGEGASHGGEQDVSSRFVRLRLDREADVVATIDNELCEKVKSLPEALQGCADILCGVGVRAFAPTQKT